MSYDLTIRADETFSEFRPIEPVLTFLATQPHLRPNGTRGFVLDDGRRWMEIDIETVSEEGDNIEDESTDPLTFNCIRAHIPYGHLGDQPELDYIPLLRNLAHRIGWKLYDGQKDDEDGDGCGEPQRPWWKFWRS